MKVFFDTSSLFKLYHKEAGTEELMSFFQNNEIEAIYLAQIAVIEFSSVVWKKCRKNEIDENTAKSLIAKFDKDSLKFSFVPDNHELRQTAKDLIGIYWQNGLRTLDSIQFSSVLRIKNQIQIFFTSDKLLSELATIEGVKVL